MPAPNEPVTVESLGWQLRAALPPLRLHSVSIYDEQANVLWLSEGALGPDEHNVVVEAIDALGSDTSLSYYETGLEDGRISIFLPVRSPQGGLVGLAMILADIKSVGDGVVERMVTPQVRTIMQKVAVLLRPAQPRGHTDGIAENPRARPGSDAAPLQASPPKPATAVSNISSCHAGGTLRRRALSAPVLSPQAVDDILEFELTPDLPTAKPAPSESMPIATASIAAVEAISAVATPSVAASPVGTPLVHSTPVASLDPPSQPTVFAGNAAQLSAAVTRKFDRGAFNVDDYERFGSSAFGIQVRR